MQMSRLRRYYPLTLTVVTAVTVVCLMPIADPPLADVPFIDKWTHIVLFGGISGVILIEMLLNRHDRLRWCAPVFASLYGGAIELMQAYLTTCRSGEWLDFAADTVGAFLALPTVLLGVQVVQKVQLFKKFK